MDIENYCSDILPKEFLKKYVNKKVNWKNGLSYIVYKRTYSRTKENGSSEEFWETLARCINGAQKIGAQYTQKEAERLYDYMFNFKCLYAGRMLWQLGTSLVDRFSGNSLINCFYTNISSIDDFCFLFENLMLGGGVGYSVRREHVHELPRIKYSVNIKHENTKDADFIVPDSRNGWVELLRKTLDSFFNTGKSFTYSTMLVRGHGEPIKTFGGTASGPKILIEGIEKICLVCKSRENKKLRSIDALDICNIIGSIVVSGNVRRSAQIALGDADDHLFLKAKRWDEGNIPNWRAMSNNTITADSYDYISNLFWEGYNGNTGEPYGLFNLELNQTYGRLKEKIQDPDIQGLNPCVRGDTMILTKYGNKRIDSIIEQEVEIWNGFEWSLVIPKITGYNQSMLKVTLSDGNSLTCTNYHKWPVSVDNYDMIASIEPKEYFPLETKDLKVGEIIWQPNHKWWNPLKVTNIEDVGVDEKVYCFNESKRHFGCFNKIITFQCGEIGLENGGVCNLSELFLNNIESKNELIDCSILLYKTQKAICSLNYLHERTTKIVHKNRRIGLGIGGICQSLHKLDWLDDCYKNLRIFDKEWSKKRNWPESIKLTTIKPSGTISLVSNSSPGVHPAFSKYYIRRVRMASNDKLVQICKEHGYKTEFQINFDNSIDRGTVIVEFPCYAGENVKLAKNMSAVEQLELVKKIQTIWADNAVSCTVYYKIEELKDIKEWLNKNYDNSVKSISFLLHKEHGFKQPPYQEITEEEYKQLIKNIKPFDIIKTENISLDGLECSSGACPIR